VAELLSLDEAVRETQPPSDEELRVLRDLEAAV
jgi:hypothetical protein